MAFPGLFATWLLLWLAGWKPGPEPPFLVAPGGRYAVVLASDHDFGQVEYVRVIADPGTARARQVFEHVGDTPLRFLRWRDSATAELEFPPQNAPAMVLLLACQADACRLAPANPPARPAD